MSLKDWQSAQNEVGRLGSPTYMPTVLTDQDFEPHLNALESCNHDNGRQHVISAMVNSDADLQLTADQVGAVMETYHHDNGRCAALELLGPRVADPAGLLRHTDTMNHDNGRAVLLKWSAGAYATTALAPSALLETRSFTVGVVVGGVGVALLSLLGLLIL